MPGPLTLGRMDYKPGDVANGHVLGSDGQWHPVGASTPSAVTRLDPNLYGTRYLRRWKWTIGTITAVLMLPVLASMFLMPDSESAIAGGLVVGPLWLLGSLCSAVFFGSLVNLVVAAFPSRVPTDTSR